MCCVCPPCHFPPMFAHQEPSWKREREPVPDEEMPTPPNTWTPCLPHWSRNPHLRMNDEVCAWEMRGVRSVERV